CRPRKKVASCNRLANHHQCQPQGKGNHPVHCVNLEKPSVPQVWRSWTWRRARPYS
ncbi:hypothetical protein GBA52_028916, partial [Prunus armeniaca]